MRKEILVTGGAGYIGSHTCISLWEAGYLPVIVDNLSNSSITMLEGIQNIIGHSLPFYQTDCCDLTSLQSIFEQHSFQGIIHFAAFKSVAESVAFPEKYHANNMGSLENILKLMEAYQIKHLVFSSSCTVYGEPKTNPVDEHTPWQDAASPYGHTKQLGELLIQDIGKSKGMSSAILRYFNPIGAHPSGFIGELPLGIPNNLVPVLLRKISEQSTLSVFGNDYPTPDGSCVRDYIHVMDLAEAHVKSLQWLEKNKNVIEHFNIGQGKGNSVLEIIRLFEDVNQQHVPFIIAPRRNGDIAQIWANAQKAADLLNWKTARSTQSALADAWRFFLQQTKN